MIKMRKILLLLLLTVSQVQQGEGQCVHAEDCGYCNGPVCQWCKAGWYLDSIDQQCYSCSENCDSCDEFSCLTCSSNSFLSNGNCEACEDENCHLCDYDWDCSLVCFECVPGYYLEPSSDVCYVCPDNCEYCWEGVCIYCESGYMLDSDSNCVPCVVDNCEFCDGDSCIICQEGYNLNLGACIPCPDYCLGCYVTEQDDNCLDSNDTLGYNMECYYCEEGFALTDTADGCEACPMNCEECEMADSSRCLRCRQGYYISPSGSCEACTENCFICADWGCEMCNSGFGLSASSNNTECEACEENCLECYAGECDYCRLGYGMVNGDCAACPLNCLMCYEGECSSCGPGYTLSENFTCIACSPNCKECDAAGCYNCMQGFVFDYEMGSGCIAIDQHDTPRSRMTQRSLPQDKPPKQVLSAKHTRGMVLEHRRRSQEQVHRLRKRAPHHLDNKVPRGTNL